MLVTLAALVVACSEVGRQDGPPPGGPYQAVNGFYRDEHSQALEWVRSHPDDPRASVIDREIASVPTSRWFTSSSQSVGSDVAEHVAAAQGRAELAVLVPYNIPVRDCGAQNTGGASDAAAYAQWIRSFADGIGARPAVVVLEPDALLHLSCLTWSQRQERLRMLSDAVNVLAQRAPAAWTYLDAGNSRTTTPRKMADQLLAAGVRNARGFALNVSNYRQYDGVVDYGGSVRAILARHHVDSYFLVDNSRNGNGAGTGWCNPPGRALGARPRIGGPEGVDASPWIKPPGESDGECGIAEGRPNTGFDPELAFALIRD